MTTRFMPVPFRKKRKSDAYSTHPSAGLSTGRGILAPRTPGPKARQAGSPTALAPKTGRSRSGPASQDATGRGFRPPEDGKDQITVGAAHSTPPDNPGAPTASAQRPARSRGSGLNGLRRPCRTFQRSVRSTRAGNSNPRGRPGNAVRRADGFGCSRGRDLTLAGRPL